MPPYSRAGHTKAMTAGNRSVSSVPPVARRRSVALAALAVLIMVLPGEATLSPAGSDGERVASLGRHRPATASSAVDTAAAAFDGDTDTSWMAVGHGPQWLAVDLGRHSAIAHLVLDWAPRSHAGQFEVQVSQDGRTWSTIGSAIGFAGRQELDVAGAGRHLRLVVTAGSDGSGYALREVGVYSATSGGCSGSDVAGGRTATASSAETPSVRPGNATDEDRSTRWSSAWGDHQWLQVDLGVTTSICRIMLGWERAYATAYDVQVSDDETKWTTVHSTTTGRGGDEVVDLAAGGRYLRLVMRARATAYGYSLWDFQVRSGAGALRRTGADGTATGPDRLLSYRKPVLASSTLDAESCVRCDAARVVDLDKATMWKTAQGSSIPAWIQIDLGAPAQVRRVELQWGAEYARGFAVQLSPDGTAWMDAYRTSDGRGYLQTLDVRGRARYVRLVATAGVSDAGYALWEFTVYGSGGAPLPAPVPTSGPRQPYRLVWGDDFDGRAGQEPDRAKWQPEIGPGYNGELQYYTDNRNARLDGRGNLVLTVRRERTDGASCPRSGGATCEYTSGRLNTNGRFSFTYGRVEARIKVSGTPGLWPAFWLLGEGMYTGAAPWPNSGEIDVMEHLGRAPRESSSTLHAAAFHGPAGIAKIYRAGTDLAAGFHTYAMDWRPDRITFSVDGTAFSTVDKATVERTRGPWVFDRPFVLLLNNAIGGDFPGPPNARTRLPQDMVVDYVRVYR